MSDKLIPIMQAIVSGVEEYCLALEELIESSNRLWRTIRRKGRFVYHVLPHTERTRK